MLRHGSLLNLVLNLINVNSIAIIFGMLFRTGLASEEKQYAYA